MAANKFRMNHFMNLCKATRLLLIMGTLLLVACSKEEDLPELDYSKVYLLKQQISEGEIYINSHIKSTFNYYYVYDSSDRIIRYVKSYPIGADTFNYIYSDSTAIMVYGSGNWQTTDTVVMMLNKKGLVVSENNITFNQFTKYRYDQDGHCVFSESYSYSTDTGSISVPYQTKTYIYDGGNLVKEVSGKGETIDYLYYKDKVNTIGNANKGMPFRGKSSQNLEQIRDAVDYFDTLNRLKTRYTASSWDYEYRYY